MAVGKPDEYQHNNEDRAFVDSTFVRGGARRADDRAALYALADKPDQLQENVTVVRVLYDAAYDGAKTKLLLVDLANAGNASGWELEGSGPVAPGPGGGSHRVSVPFDEAHDYDLVHNLGYPPDTELFDEQGARTTAPTRIVDVNTLRFYFSPPMAGTITYLSPLNPTR